jgi:nucleotide-binding universal stress UspA family protein
MYKHILIPDDGSDLSVKAVEHGMALAKAVNAKVTGITVTAPFHIFAMEPGMVTDTREEYTKHVAALASKYLERIKGRAASTGVNCDVLLVEHEHPYRAIVDAANSRGCDLIVMASHGRRGASAIVLGSETVKVLTHSTIPVLVCR